MGDIQGTLKNNQRLANRAAARRREEANVASEVASLRHDNAVVLLETKLKAWMVQQPEWLTITELPRQQRRAAMRELANRLYTIPMMDGVNTVPRQLKRKAAKQLAHVAKTGQMTADVLEALQVAAVIEEARASVALDGETQHVTSDEELAEVLAQDQAAALDAGGVADLSWASPDPEGDVKADLEAARHAEEASGTWESPPLPVDTLPEAPQEAVGATESDVEPVLDVPPGQFEVGEALEELEEVSGVSFIEVGEVAEAALEEGDHDEGGEG